MTADLTIRGFQKNHSRPLAALAEVRSHLEKIAPVHEADQGPLRRAARDLARVCGRLGNRLEKGVDAPVVAVVLGATGTGKSKIFNTLAGGPVSPSGFKRPTTMAPVILAPTADFEYLHAPGFMPDYEKREAGPGGVAFPPEPAREIIIVPVEKPVVPGVVLVDTPDFDSVLAENRAAAENVFLRADIVVFVTDAVKYADQAAWDYLERIRDRRIPAAVVVNRLRNPLSLEDFSRRLREAGLERPVFSLPDEPGLADDQPLPADRPGLAEVRALLTRYAGESRAETLLAGVRADWAELQTGMDAVLLPGLGDAEGRLAEIRLGLDEEAAKARDEIGRVLSVSISGELKNSLTTQIQALFLRWDILRYPRRIMAMPVNFIRDRLLVPLGVAGEPSAKKGLDAQIDRLFEANREGLAAVIGEFNRLAAERFEAGEVGRGLKDREDFEGLALSGEEVRAAYGQVRADLEAWVGEQARELVKDLDLGEKMTFYLAQIVSLGLFISIQVHTGGGFSFLDGVVDSVLAPILSKITGSALSRDKVKAFEERAAQKHLEGCLAVVDRQADAYTGYVQGAQEGLAPAGGLVKAWTALEKDFGSLS